jgi:hypothetical protein
MDATIVGVLAAVAVISALMLIRRKVGLLQYLALGALVTLSVGYAVSLYGEDGSGVFPYLVAGFCAIALASLIQGVKGGSGFTTGGRSSTG